MLSFIDPVIVLTSVYVVIHWPCYCTYKCLCCHSLILLLYLQVFMLSFIDPVIVLTSVYVVIHWPCYCTYKCLLSFIDPVIVLTSVYVVIHWPCYCTYKCLCCHSLTLLLYLQVFMLSFIFVIVCCLFEYKHVLPLKIQLSRRRLGFH